ncbi:hypothetical protein BDF22DRAFT_739357 [Syncephalis plumigaleata]|nr:hypothetical protein BDF22DRAFT_739357 [Syncephalis plumigaleata]
MSFIKQYHGKLLPVVAPLLSLQQVRRYGMVTQRTIFTGRPLLSLLVTIRNESYRWMMAQRLKSSLMYSQATSNHSALASTRCLRQYSTDITVDVNTSATLSRVDASTLTLDWQHGPSNTFLHFGYVIIVLVRSVNILTRNNDRHIAIEQDNLKLTWPDGHKTNYPLSWLYQQLPNNQSTRMKESIAAATTTLWDAGI